MWAEGVGSVRYVVRGVSYSWIRIHRKFRGRSSVRVAFDEDNGASEGSSVGFRLQQKGWLRCPLIRG